MSDRTREERFNQRMRRTREKIDEALVGFDYEPSYLLSDGQYLHPHVECKRCRSVVKAVGMAPFEHWVTHHRLRGTVMRWLMQRVKAQAQSAPPPRERYLLSEGSADVSDTFRDAVGDKGVERLNQPGRPLRGER